MKSPVKLEDYFSRLVDNALNFLSRSIEDLQQSPKYSVIHFYAAVELFLKARLMKEHWSLVVTKPQDADWEKFVAGDFQAYCPIALRRLAFSSAIFLSSTRRYSLLSSRRR